MLKTIFYQRIITETPLTLEEIGAIFDVTTARIRDVESKLLYKIRGRLIRSMNPDQN